MSVNPFFQLSVNNLSVNHLSCNPFSRTIKSHSSFISTQHLLPCLTFETEETTSYLQFYSDYIKAERTRQSTICFGALTVNRLLSTIHLFIHRQRNLKVTVVVILINNFRQLNIIQIILIYIFIKYSALIRPVNFVKCWEVMFDSLQQYHGTDFCLVLQQAQRDTKMQFSIGIPIQNILFICLPACLHVYMSVRLCAVCPDFRHL